MGYIKNVVERSENNRKKELKTGLENPELSEGAFKSVHVTPRNTVVKTVYTDQTPQEANTDNVDEFPWAVLDVEDLSDIGLSNESALIEMRRSDMSHEEAKDIMGVRNVIHSDLEMFFGLLEEGILYGDFKPANINYFRSGDQWEPRPIDIFDPEAAEPYSSGYQEVVNALSTYIFGTDDYDGVTDMYDLAPSEAEVEILNYLGEDVSEYMEDGVYEFEDGVSLDSDDSDLSPVEHRTIHDLITAAFRHNRY